MEEVGELRKDKGSRGKSSGRAEKTEEAAKEKSTIIKRRFKRGKTNAPFAALRAVT